MWWLSFRDGVVVILNASSLAHARLLAARDGLGHASHFVEGHFIESERMPPIPAEFIGRTLSPIEARHVENLLNHDLRDRGAVRPQPPRPKPLRPQS